MKRLYVLGFAFLMVLWGLFAVGDSYGKGVYFCDSTSLNTGRSLYLLKQDGTGTGQRAALADRDIAHVSGTSEFYDGAGAVTGTGISVYQVFEYDANATDSSTTAYHPHIVRPIDYSSAGVWKETGVISKGSILMIGASGESVFVSATDGKLYFSDSSGVDNALY